MTITISINITLEASDLVTLGQQLLGQHLAAALLETPAAPTATPEPTPKAHRTPPAPAKRPAIIAPTAQEGPEAHRTDVREENVPAEPVTPRIEAIPPATNEKDEGRRMKDEGKPAKRNTQPRPQLPFAEFDTLVGKELKRLSVDGRIPSASLWDEHRDQRLPTYGAVMQRYGCSNLASFAEKMGMQPPLTRAMTINQNGANAIHSKSEVVP